MHDLAANFTLNGLFNQHGLRIPSLHCVFLSLFLSGHKNLMTKANQPRDGAHKVCWLQQTLRTLNLAPLPALFQIITKCILHISRYQFSGIRVNLMVGYEPQLRPTKKSARKHQQICFTRMGLLQRLFQQVKFKNHWRSTVVCTK